MCSVIVDRGRDFRSPPNAHCGLSSVFSVSVFGSVVQQRE
jgi:hypothetical protein